MALELGSPQGASSVHPVYGVGADVIRAERASFGEVCENGSKRDTGTNSPRWHNEVVPTFKQLHSRRRGWCWGCRWAAQARRDPTRVLVTVSSHLSVQQLLSAATNIEVGCSRDDHTIIRAGALEVCGARTNTGKENLERVSRIQRAAEGF